MSTESPSLKSKFSTTKDSSRIDQSLGFVSASDIRNLWIEFIRLLDVDVWPRGKMPIRDEVMTLFESLQYKMLSRAENNYQKFLKPPLSAPKAQEISPQEKAAYESRQARLASWK